MHRASKLALALVLAAPGCAGSVPPTAPPPSVETSSLCHFIGAATTSLRTSEAGFTFVETHDAPLEGLLVREDVLRLRGVSTADGYRLEGRIDLDRDDVFRVRAMTPFVPSVWLAPGTLVRVVDAAPTRDREAQLTIGPSRTFDDELHFETQPSSVVACSQLGFAPRGWDYDTMVAERVALGLPRATAMAQIAAGRAVPISSGPGGAAFATIGPFEQSRMVHVLQEQGELTSVLVYSASGAMVAGWIPSSELIEPPGTESSDGADAIDETTVEVCLSLTALELFASRDGTTERVGSVDPNVQWILDELADGSVAIRPYRSPSLSIAEGVTWLVRPGEPIVCGRASEPSP